MLTQPRFFTIAACLIAITILPNSIYGATSSLVSEAKTFAENKTYKLNPTPQERSAGKYDCTTFVQAVLAKRGYQVGGVTGQQINIVLSSEDRAQLATLVRNKDKKIKGVVQALVDSQQGTEIATLNQAAPGDIVQMWSLTGNSARGHTGVVKSVNVTQNRLVLIGAHNVNDGVGEKSFTLSSNDWSVAFFVRPSH